MTRSQADNRKAKPADTRRRQACLDNEAAELERRRRLHSDVECIQGTN